MRQLNTKKRIQPLVPVLGVFLGFALLSAGCVEDTLKRWAKMAEDISVQLQEEWDAKVLESLEDAALVDGMNLDEISGNLRLYMTATEGPFDSMWVSIDGAHILSDTREEAEGISVVDETQDHDLVQMQNNVTAVLGDSALEVRPYGHVRIHLSDVTITSDDNTALLPLIAGDQAIVDVPVDLVVQESETYALVLEFDSNESIVLTESGFSMDPVIRVRYLGVLNDDGSLTALYKSSDDADELDTDASPEDWQ